MSSPRLFRPAVLVAAALTLALAGAVRAQSDAPPGERPDTPADTPADISPDAPAEPTPETHPAARPPVAPAPASAPSTPASPPAASQAASAPPAPAAASQAAQPGASQAALPAASQPSAPVAASATAPPLEEAASQSGPQAAPPPASQAVFQPVRPSAASAAVTTTTTTTTTTTAGPQPVGQSPIAPASAPRVQPQPPSAALPPVTPANAPMAARNDPKDQLIRDARDAFGRRDRARLAALRAQAISQKLQLAPWVDYWDLTQRLNEVDASEVEAFYARWPGSYVEDRLRNDWLLELGRRRDWANFSRDYPRFRMNDDREVTCYATLVDHLAGKDVRAAARAAWLAQRDADDGCQLLAQTLFDAKVFTQEDVWRRLRQAAEAGRQRAARGAAQMLGKPTQKAINDLWDNPARFLTRRGELGTARRADLVTLALARMAASDAGAAALQMRERWESTLEREDAAWTWGVIARHGAQSLDPDAVDWADRAWTAWKAGKGAGERPDWSDDTLDWHARAAIRLATGPAAKQRWRDLLRAIDAMSPANRASDAWVYWRARAHLALAKEGAAGEAARAEARNTLTTLSTSLGFYGLLAAEDLGMRFTLPARPAAITHAERAAARASPGLQRALALASLDLRDEARREWNFTLRGMDDRQLLAAAQWACDVNDWQLCINTSERTKDEIDLLQRYPMPFQQDITAAAQAAGLEPAFVFGLIRQETRFMPTLRSHVGAAGLMQIMPSTAKWTAKKSGMAYSGDQIADPQVNLRLGTFYLKLVLDSFGSSAPMAAAAYNAGPARPRRWRGGLMLDPAVWTENVPFYETRDYVKKVMTNASIYAALQSGAAPALRPRLGPQIGPRDAEQASTEIP